MRFKPSACLSVNAMSSDLLPQVTALLSLN
jgi:hypothetical protein